jgi:hypothetical protein
MADKISLKANVSKIREILIKDFASKFEKLGFDNKGNISIDIPMSNQDMLVKNNLVSIFESKNISGNQKEFIKYIQDCARTFLHILICFKTMEKRQLMGKLLKEIIPNNIYNEVLPDFKNVHPYAFMDIVDKYEDEIDDLERKDNYKEDTEYYKFILVLQVLSKEMAKEVPLLFKDFEHTILYPDFESIKAIINILSSIKDEEFYEDDFLGWIYQYWVDVKADEIKIAKNNEDISYKDKIYSLIINELEEEQTQFGEFYTPRWVVKYIVDNTLKPYWEENKNIDNIKLLDPACGAGNFLVYSFDVFYELYKVERPEYSEETIVKKILENNIFGVDIQREPLQISALNLWLKAKGKAADAKITEMKLFNMNILKANSLYRYENDIVTYQISLFDQDIDFNENTYTAEDIGKYISNQEKIFQRKAKDFFSQKFEVIVMNPPYLDLSAASRRFNGKTGYDEIRKLHEFLQVNYKKSSHNLFAAFIERVLELIKKDTVWGFIGSDTFMSLSTFEGLRDMILDSQTIISIDHLGLNVFEGPVVNAVILVLKNRKINKNTEDSIKVKDLQNLNSYDKQIYLYEKESDFCTSVLQRSFNIIKGRPFVYNITEELRNIFLLKDTIGGENNGLAEIRGGIKLRGNEDVMKYKWEIPSYMLENQQWVYLNKGGDYSKYLTENYLVIPWNKDNRYLFYWLLEKLGQQSLIYSFINDFDLEQYKKQKFSEEDFRYLHDIIKEIIGIETISKEAAIMKLNEMSFQSNSKIEFWSEFYKFLNRYYPSYLTKNYPHVRFRNIFYYFKPGITYGALSSKGFSARLLKENRVFEISGPGIFIKDNNNKLVLLAYLNSKLCKFILDIINPTVNFQRGDLEKVPYKKFNYEKEQLINEYINKIIENKERNFSYNYISEYYKNSEIDSFLNEENLILKQAFIAYINNIEEKEVKIAFYEDCIDEIIYSHYKINSIDRKIIERKFGESLFNKGCYIGDISKEEFQQLYCIGDPKKESRSQRPMSIIEIAEYKGMNPDDVLELRKEYGIYREKDLKQAVLNWLRAIVKDYIKEQEPKLYLDEDIEKIIRIQIEKNFKNGYELINEAEAILEKSLIGVIRSGVKIGSSNVTLAGKGSKDLDEPLLQQKVISGTGASKTIVIWHLQQFLLEFEEDKKYVMQNEIRRIKELLEPRLRNCKEKLLAENIKAKDKKELEKEEKLLVEGIKVLDNWKVV